MNVLSLFDGISCGQLALQRANIKYDTYYASEIDANAIAIAQRNFPNTVHLGDITKVDIGSLPKIDLLIGGSPCQGFSSSGKGLNFDDPRSRLFFKFAEVLDFLKNINPNLKFMLENVKMKKEWSDIISQRLGTCHNEVNSRYFSAQNRVRYYWCNFEILKYEDKNIMLKDVVEDNYINSAAMRTRPIVEEGHRKSVCLEVNGIGKSMCLVTVNLNNKLTPLPKGRYIDALKNNYPYRNMTVKEMERLQTIPEGYVGNIGINKAAKVLGNAWTVDVISHILKGM